MNEGGLVFVEGVKLAEPEYLKGVKLTEPDPLIACVSLVHLVFNIFIYLHQQNSLQAYYNGSQYHAPDTTKDNLLIHTITHKHILTILM